jgi:hypothetical protein
MSFKVYYCPVDFFEENTVQVEDLSNHKDYVYSACPVWRHRHDRTFIGYSPCTFRMGLEDDILWYKLNDENEVEVPFENEESSNGIISYSISDIDQIHPVIQLGFINSLFWTDFDNEYVWFEFLDHPETALNNNFIAIGGWFNIGSYPRTTSLAIKIQDASKDIYIEKGDPLYRIRFYSQNMNDTFKLEKKEAPEKLMNSFEERRDTLVSDRKFRNTILFDKDARAKCPFHNV